MDNLGRVEDLSGSDLNRRRAAAQHFLRDGVPDEAVAALVRASGDPDELVRESVVAALEELSSPPVTIITRVIPLLEHPGPDVSYWAATVIGRMGRAAGEAATPLARLLQSDAAAASRQRAAWALERIGPAAASALPALQEAAQQGDPRLARLARGAIAAIVGT